jgi:hypothetical protein
VWPIEGDFGLHDWIYCTLYIHTTRDHRQYSAVAILHTLQFTVTQALGFSVFTSRILATDLWQSHDHFKSYMKSSSHGLTHFLSLLLNHLRLPSPKLDPLLDNSTQMNSSSAEFSQRLTATNRYLGTSRYIALGRNPRKIPSSVVPHYFRRVYWPIA